MRQAPRQRPSPRGTALASSPRLLPHPLALMQRHRAARATAPSPGSLFVAGMARIRPPWPGSDRHGTDPNAIEQPDPARCGRPSTPTTRAPPSPSPHATCSPSSRAALVTGDCGHLRLVLLDSARLSSEYPTAVVATIGEISATTPDPVCRSRDRVTQDDPATLLYSSGTTAAFLPTGDTGTGRHLWYTCTAQISLMQQPEKMVSVHRESKDVRAIGKGPRCAGVLQMGLTVRQAHLAAQKVPMQGWFFRLKLLLKETVPAWHAWRNHQMDAT